MKWTPPARRCAAKMAALIRKSPLRFETLPLPPKPISRLPNPAPISSILGRRTLLGVRFPCYSLQSLPDSTSSGGFFPVRGRLGFGLGPKGWDFVRLRAVSDGGFGSGSDDGGYGGRGDGGAGDGCGGESGGKRAVTDVFSIFARVRSLCGSDSMAVG